MKSFIQKLTKLLSACWTVESHAQQAIGSQTNDPAVPLKRSALLARHCSVQPCPDLRDGATFDDHLSRNLSDSLLGEQGVQEPIASSMRRYASPAAIRGLHSKRDRAMRRHEEPRRRIIACQHEHGWHCTTVLTAAFIVPRHIVPRHELPRNAADLMHIRRQF